MANKEHLRTLRQGVDVWNRWRQENPEIRPNLSCAHLIEANLSMADLSRADLTEADLRMADISGADLSSAILRKAVLRGANLRMTVLRRAALHGSFLNWVDLSEADLTEANLTKASMGRTTLGNVDLSGAKGLDSVRHTGPSTIGIDTIYRSRGKIPAVFLRGAGVPDSMIEFMHSLVRSQQAIDFYSCFISYSSKDRDFSHRLHNDLQAKGVRCWFAPDDMKIGDKIRPILDQSVRTHDKLLIILSENSIGSDWVEQEVETALARERKEKRTVLFPIRLDDAVMEIDVGWPALIRNTRHIGDFRNWKDHDAYQRELRRLLRDLKTETSEM